MKVIYFHLLILGVFSATSFGLALAEEPKLLTKVTSYTTKFGVCNKQRECDFSYPTYYRSSFEGDLPNLKKTECKEEGFQCWEYIDVSHSSYFSKKPDLNQTVGLDLQSKQQQP